jgi:hypothetical protein
MRIPTLSVPIWISKKGKKTKTLKLNSKGRLHICPGDIKPSNRGRTWTYEFIKKCKTNIMQQNGRNTS